MSCTTRPEQPGGRPGQRLRLRVRHVPEFFGRPPNGVDDMRSRLAGRPVQHPRGGRLGDTGRGATSVSVTAAMGLSVFGDERPSILGAHPWPAGMRMRLTAPKADYSRECGFPTTRSNLQEFP